MKALSTKEWQAQIANELDVEIQQVVVETYTDVLDSRLDHAEIEHMKVDVTIHNTYEVAFVKTKIEDRWQYHIYRFRPKGNPEHDELDPTDELLEEGSDIYDPYEQIPRPKKRYGSDGEQFDC